MLWRPVRGVVGKDAVSGGIKSAASAMDEKLALGGGICSLSLRERVGVRGSWGTALSYARPDAAGATSLSRGSKDPVTQTLSRREREQAGG